MWLFLAISGETKYGDYMETTVFNAVQGARTKDEKAIQYFSSPYLPRCESSCLRPDLSFEIPPAMP